MNSREKGKRGERELASVLRRYGYNDVHRGTDGKFEPKGNIFFTTKSLIYCFSSEGDLLFFTNIENSSQIIDKK